ncbi:pectinesterase family protein [Parabacteroides sp. OttesenSCG-928-K15]|nr:pectinesterase family protein [Parabacteroides sp. OttesenSCG-928-K15]
MKQLIGCLLLSLSLLSFTTAPGITVFMIGDSTMADKDLAGGNPERGWGHVLPGFFSSEVKIDNYALNGRSTKSFIEEGHWVKVLDKIKPGDYLFIQFGHNDQKEDKIRHTDPGSSFDANLKRFITEARAKGAIPVLFTSIVRRHFDTDGQLTDTHGAYITATKRVAAETSTPLIDLNKLTHDWVQSLGDEASRKYFMWIPPQTLACCPEGKEDDTHLNVAGAKAVATLAVQEIEKEVPALAASVRYYDFVVAQDGSGDFFTVQEAINAVPDYRREGRTRIFIRKGEYYEKLIIAESKVGVSLFGEEGTVLTYDDYAHENNIFGEVKTTSGSVSCYIYGENFYAEHITFSNTFGIGSQAVALLVAGDRSVFKHCRFLGHQDTLYTYGMNSRQYYEDCYIEGTVDFIFGWSTAVFNRCHIHNKGNGYVTAPSTPQGKAYGYVFLDCRLTADPGVNKVYLSRPWRNYAKAVFIRCQMDGHILPEGWHNWKKPEAEKTIFYAEYQNSGEGASKQRASFSSQLEDISGYSIPEILAGADGWNPLEDPQTLMTEKK